jgi:hypothetical protein
MTVEILDNQTAIVDATTADTILQQLSDADLLAIVTDQDANNALRVRAQWELAHREVNTPSLHDPHAFTTGGIEPRIDPDTRRAFAGFVLIAGIGLALLTAVLGLYYISS